MPHKRLSGPPPNEAIIEMKLAGEGYDPPPPPCFDAPPPPPGEPLRIEPADWRAEEAAAKAREAQDEMEPEQPSYPAKKKPKSKTPTPRLDEVLAWREKTR